MTIAEIYPQLLPAPEQAPEKSHTATTVVEKLRKK